MDIEQKAERARAILNDDLVIEAVSKIRERQMNAFANSAIGDAEALSQARLKLWAIEQVVGELQSSIDELTIRKGKVRKRDND
jgi:hypothetical protein